MARTTTWGAALAAVALTRGALAASVLETSGFTNCQAGSSIEVNTVDIKYDKSAETVTFDVSGTSSIEQKVMATLNVTAYGFSVYSNTFNPCDNSTYVKQMCPGECNSSDLAYCDKKLLTQAKYPPEPSPPVERRISQRHTPARFLP